MIVEILEWRHFWCLVLLKVDFEQMYSQYLVVAFVADFSKGTLNVLNILII